MNFESEDKAVTRSEVKVMFDAASKEANAIWNGMHGEAARAYSLAIQQDGSVAAMIAADRRHDQAMRKADALFDSALRKAHERLLEQLKGCKE